MTVSDVVIGEVNGRISACDNDIHAAYAELCNQMIGKTVHDTWLEVKQYFEYLLACEAMKEYNWIQTDDGGWRKLTDEEIFSHWYPRKGV